MISDCDNKEKLLEATKLILSKYLEKNDMVDIRIHIQKHKGGIYQESIYGKIR